MSTLRTEDVLPTRLPDGFRFRRRVDAADGHGFSDDPDRIMLVLTRGYEHSDWSNAITVHYAPRTRQPLFGTEKRKGTKVDLGVNGADAVYHDGIWAMDAARVDAGAAPADGLYWSDTAHSITVTKDGVTYAVRAPRDVSVEDLTGFAATMLNR